MRIKTWCGLQEKLTLLVVSFHKCGAADKAVQLVPLAWLHNITPVWFHPGLVGLVKLLWCQIAFFFFSLESLTLDPEQGRHIILLLTSAGGFQLIIRLTACKSTAFCKAHHRPSSIVFTPHQATVSNEEPNRRKKKQTNQTKEIKRLLNTGILAAESRRTQTLAGEGTQYSAAPAAVWKKQTSSSVADMWWTVNSGFCYRQHISPAKCLGCLMDQWRHHQPNH